MNVFGKVKIGSKGDMALEYIFKILIMLVVVAVIVMLIVQFSNEIRQAVQGFVCKFSNTCGGTSDEFPKNIEQDSFTSGEIATYIDSCLSSNLAKPEGEQKGIVCYTLLAAKAPYFDANKDSILSSISPNIRDKVSIDTDFSKHYIKIEFEDISNGIIVE